MAKGEEWQKKRGEEKKEDVAAASGSDQKPFTGTGSICGPRRDVALSKGCRCLAGKRDDRLSGGERGVEEGERRGKRRDSMVCFVQDVQSSACRPSKQGGWGDVQVKADVGDEPWKDSRNKRMRRFWVVAQTYCFWFHSGKRKKWTQRCIQDTTTRDKQKAATAG